MTKRFASLDEFEQHYYPKSILDRLQKTICENMMFKRSSITKSDSDPFTGILRFARPSYLPKPEELSEVVQNFYLKEGFEVQKKDNKSLDVKKNSEHYIVIMTGADDHIKNYRIWITECPYRSFFKGEVN